MQISMYFFLKKSLKDHKLKNFNFKDEVKQHLNEPYLFTHVFRISFEV